MSVSFITSDGVNVEMKKEAVDMSEFIKEMLLINQDLEDVRGEEILEKTPKEISLENIDSQIFNIVKNFCENRVQPAKPDTKYTPITEWDKNFFSKIPTTDLLNILSAAIFLQIKPLRFATSKRIGELIKVMEPYQCRKALNVKPEELWVEVCNLNSLDEICKVLTDKGYFIAASTIVGKTTDTENGITCTKVMTIEEAKEYISILPDMNDKEYKETDTFIKDSCK